MANRSSAPRKADLSPAFTAAKDAGWSEVRVVVETPDGFKYEITATEKRSETADASPLDEWRTTRDAS